MGYVINVFMAFIVHNIFIFIEFVIAFRGYSFSYTLRVSFFTDTSCYIELLKIFNVTNCKNTKICQTGLVEVFN